MKNTYKFTNDDTLAIKALGIMLMLAHHLFAFPQKLINGASYNSLYITSNDFNIEYYFGDFGKLCVALFMMLAGYGMYCSYAARKDAAADSSDKSVFNSLIIRRVKNVYTKYWQIFIIFIPIGIILGAPNIEPTIGNIVKNFFAIETNFNGEWWFFTIYLLMLFVFPVAVRLLDRKHANPWTDILWVIIANEFFNTAVVTFLNTNEYTKSFYSTYFTQKMILILVMFPMFFAGCYLAKYDIIAKIRACFSTSFSAKLTGIVILAVIFILRKNWPMRASWGWDKLDFVYACVFTIACALILDGLTPIRKGLAFIGRQSTGMWLIHSFFCYYYWQQFTYATKNPILIYIILFVVSFGLSFIIDFIFNNLGKFAKSLKSS